MDDLAALGWTDERAAELAALPAGLVAARVVVELRGQPQLSRGGEPFPAVVGGGLRHRAAPGALPVIGDWVAVRQVSDGAGVIAAVLARTNALARLGADGREQVLAANLDLAVVVMGLDNDFNVRRLERFLALTAAAGVPTVILLSKADLGGDLDGRVAEVAAVAGGAAVAAFDLRGDEAAAWLAARLAPGQTVVLLGSSGAGKSTLTNRLLGAEVQRTGAVRAHDNRGQHTTTHRELFALPGGALLIDTPGLRALALDDDGSRPAAFDDIDAVAAACQFRDCRHDVEPGCAVTAALARGELDAARVASYQKLAAELRGGRPDGRAPRGRKR